MTTSGAIPRRFWSTSEKNWTYERVRTNPRGFTWNGDHLIPNVEEQQVNLTVRALYARHRAYNAVRVILNEHGPLTSRSATWSMGAVKHAYAATFRKGHLDYETWLNDPKRVCHRFEGPTPLSPASLPVPQVDAWESPGVRLYG